MKVSNGSGGEKIIPRKYEVIEEIHKYFDDLEKKRLTKEERESLDVVLFGMYFDVFRDTLKKESPHVFDLIKSRKVEHVARVTTKHSSYCIARMDCGIDIRIDISLFRLYPGAGEINRLY